MPKHLLKRAWPARHALNLWIVLAVFFGIAIALVVGNAIFMYTTIHGELRAACDTLSRSYGRAGTEGLVLALWTADIGPGLRLHLVDLDGKDLATGRPWMPEPSRPSPRVVARYARYSCIAERRPGGPPAPLNPIAWLLVIVSVLCCSIGMYVTWRMRRIEAAIRHFGSGELAVRIPSDSSDAIGQLATTFNQMADRIQSLIAAQQQLCADVAHELRSPLTRLCLAVPGARRGTATAIDRIEQEAARVSHLLDELLEVARAEADRGTLESVEVETLITEVADYCAIEAAARPCEIEVEVRGEAGSVLGDPELLRRAVENVVRNAVRYTSQGSTVRLTASGGHRGAEIAVRDYGPGVPEAALADIFKPFYRADRALTGAGLGLAIALRAIAVHRGTIRAENCSPGLCVTISIPRS